MKRKKLIYSYKDFSDYDLKVKPAFSLSQLNLFDKVELDLVSDEEKINIISKGIVDTNSESEFVFKDFVITEICDTDEKNSKYKYWDQLRYWAYSQDSLGNMRVEVYTKSVMTNKFVNDYRFLVKTGTMYQLFNNLNEIDSTSDYNTYVIPVYLMTGAEPPFRSQYKYERFSDFARSHPKKKNEALQFLLSALARIIAFNTLCFTKDDTNIDQKNIGKTKVNINYYSADSNKDQYILINDPNNEIHRRKNQNNTELRIIDKNIYRRKFQVRGHWHKYWIGKRGDQHLETKWIAPYYKNKDAKFSVIKHYCFSPEEKNKEKIQ